MHPYKTRNNKFCRFPQWGVHKMAGDTMIGHNSAGYGQMLKPALPASPKAPKGRFPYLKFYPRDWIEATRDMSLEARGAYIDLICIIMEMEGHLADNDKWISHQMHVSPRKWKAVKAQLVGHEKIRIEDGKILNERCLKELDALLAQRQNISGSALVRERTKRDSRVSQPRTGDEKSEKRNENNVTDTTVVPLRARASDLDTDREEERKKDTTLRRDREEPSLSRAAATVAMGVMAATSSLPAAAAPVDPPAIVQPVKLTLAQMTERMLDAGGKALANPAGAMGLLTFSELQRWLADGCDFETDILQTIRAVSAKRLQKNQAPIGTWGYFTQPIADAKKTRLAPMPPGGV